MRTAARCRLPESLGGSPPQSQVLLEAAAGVDIDLMSLIIDGLLIGATANHPDGNGPIAGGSDTQPHI